MNVRTFLIIAAVVLVAALGAIWFLQKDSPSLPAQVQATTPAVAPAVALPAPPAQSATKPGATPLVVRPIPIFTPPPMAEWEIKIDQVLRTNSDDSEAGNRATMLMLLNLLPTLPPDGQAEAAQHISNLLDDKDYARVLPIVKNPQTTEEVLDVFTVDLMNRSDAVKLPALLEIAKIPNHPHREEAATDLQIFLDEDYGNDWPKWETAMKAYLKKQAQEEAESEAASATAPPQ